VVLQNVADIAFIRIMHSDKIDVIHAHGTYFISKHLSICLNLVSKSPANTMLSINLSIHPWTWFFDGLA